MANSGVFNIDDINFLKDNQQYPSIGELQHIETQQIIGTPTTIEFTSIQQHVFDIHFLTYSNVQGNSTTAQDLRMRLSKDGGSSYETSNYSHAKQNNQSSGSSSEIRGTSENMIFLTGDLDNETNATVNGYIYFYGLGNSEQYTMMHDKNTFYQSAVGLRYRNGSMMWKDTSVVNAIQFITSAGGGFKFGTFALYGIKI